MNFTRTVVPEELDSLGPDDPAAIRSRRDLRRVHRAMGTCSVLTRELHATMGKRAVHGSPLRVLELGAGDGSLMLRVARSLNSLKLQWPPVELTLLDQVDLLDSTTRSAYEATGWTATAKVMNALDWARNEGDQGTTLRGEQHEWDLIVANLFLHHFQSADLQVLLSAIARSNSVFVACEPRRSALALAGSHCVGALGASRVTRADAVTSVHAGFTDDELSALWVPGDRWVLNERRAGLFSHCFTAQRIAPADVG